MGRLAIPPASDYSSKPPDEGTRHAGEAPSGVVAVMLVEERKLPEVSSLVRGFSNTHFSQE
jgi:hypothetical protein